jgi:hypothetical protein
MHRHVAITLFLLCADITYDSTNCYIHRTLTTKSLRRGDIKGFADPKIPPEELIQDIFNGKRSYAPLLKSNITITAYIPTMMGEDIDTIMEVTCGQSQSVSDNKLSSAAQTLSTSLHDCLPICFTLVGSRMLIAESGRPDIQYKINVQQAITDQAYRKKIEQSKEFKHDGDFNWYPECISNKNWQALLKNPLDTDIFSEYTTQALQCKNRKNGKETMTPPFLISFKHITRDLGPTSTKNNDLLMCAI